MARIAPVIFRDLAIVLFWAAGLLATAIPADTALGQTGDPLPASIAACDGGDTSACNRAGMILADVESKSYDAFLALRFLQTACNAREIAACGRLALIFFSGEGDVMRDLPSAGNFAQRACSGRDRDGCEVAEAVFSDTASPQFDAEAALRYRKINCDFGRWQSCEQLARIYFNIGDERNAEQVAAHACRPGDASRKEICDLANSLKSRRLKVEQAQAEQRIAERNRQIAMQQQKRAIIDSFIRSRDYDGAIYAAIYHSKTAEDAAYALEAAHRAGALGTVYEDLLYILDYWLPSGRMNQIVTAELRSRTKSNDCGIFNCTNMPGASSKRWAAQNGGGSSYRRPSSPGGSSNAPSVLSSADARQQTRNKYRSAHCTMNNNSNRYLCN